MNNLRPKLTLFLLLISISVLITAIAQAHRHIKELKAPNCERPNTAHERSCCVYAKESRCKQVGFKTPATATKLFAPNCNGPVSKGEKLCCKQPEYCEKAGFKKPSSTVQQQPAELRTPNCENPEPGFEKTCCKRPSVCATVGFKEPSTKSTHQTKSSTDTQQQSAGEQPAATSEVVSPEAQSTEGQAELMLVNCEDKQSLPILALVCCGDVDVDHMTQAEREKRCAKLGFRLQ